MGSCSHSRGDDTKSIHYQSPKAVFDAYREAQEKQEWRKLFSLLTPEAQKDAVFESFFACMERHGADAITRRDTEGMDRLIRKYLDTSTLNEDFQKQYEKKHGVDQVKSEADHQSDQKFVPPPRDDQLWHDIVAAHINDKAGFYEAVAKYFDESAAKRHEGNQISKLGDLEQVVLHDDTASGQAKVTIMPRPGETKGGGPPPAYDKPFKFRRIDGGWLIDSL
jgi:hypothetical protein